MPGDINRKRPRGIGCGYLVKLTVGTSLLMIANSYLVGKLVEASLPSIPEFFHDVRLFQFCQIFFPIFLVMLQFWLYDRFRDYQLRRQAEQDQIG